MSDHLAELRQLYEQGLLSEAAFVAAGGKAETHGVNSVHVEDSTAQMVIGGENNHVTAIINQVEKGKLTDAEMREEIGRYLATVIAENSHIRLTGIQRQGRNVMDLPLDEVYVPLAARDSWGGSQPIPLTQLLQQGDHLVVTGGPGCGKSTVLMHIAWVLARAMGENNLALAQQKLNFTGEILPLPILIPLNRFADHLRRHRTDPPEQRTLARFISHYLIERQRTNSGSPLHTFFDQLLNYGEQVILLLDGLDEVPNEAERVAVSQKIEDLVKQHTYFNEETEKWEQTSLKIIVTCRTAAYKDRTALGGPFREIQVQPLDGGQVAALIRQAYAAVEPSLTVCQTQADDLIAGIANMEAERQRRLGDNADRLATSPLMVRMLLIVHVSDRRLPEQRAELFKRVVENMLLPDYHTDATVRNELGENHLQHLELLQTLAFHMHQQGDKGREIDEQDMRRLLEGQEHLRPWMLPFISITRQRGTLMEEHLGAYRFVHLGFQEFLAARYLAEVLGYEQKLADFILADGRLTDSWWREPFLLLVGFFSVTSTTRAERLVRFLAGIGELEGQHLPQGGDIAWIAAHFVGTAVLEWANGPTRLTEAVVQRLVNLIETQLAHPLVAPVWRAQLGTVLAALGDPRAGVCTREPLMLPVAGADFAIAKYPVTNAQFGYFVKDGGYIAKWDKVWSAEGLRWRNKEQWYQPRYWEDERFNQLNQPVGGISWYEAEAYVNWLSEEAGQQYRLPTEGEWEQAVWKQQSGDSPWREWVEGDANTKMVNIGRTSAVGLFPQGMVHCGAHDMAGNVWEWTSSWSDKGKDSFVVRGSSWNNYQGNARLSYRSRHNPHRRDNNLGMRLVRVPHFSPL